MNKIYGILLLGLIVIVVALSGCVQQASTPAIQYVCSNGLVVADKNLCPVAEVAKTSVPEPLSIEAELTVCSGMPLTQNYSLEDVCITGVAAKHQDILLCRKVSSDKRSTCYTTVAEVKGDPNMCSQAELMEDQCYSQYAMDKKDGPVCDKIKDVGSKDSCYNNLANQLGDPKLCDKILSVNQKDNCYLNMGQRLGDSSYCNKITNESYKQNCLQNMQGYQGKSPESKQIEPMKN